MRKIANKASTGGLALFLLLPGVASAVGEAKTVQNPIRLGITTVLVDHAIDTNKSLAAYIGWKIGVPIEVVQKPSFQAINDMMERHEIDIAFVCSSSYTIGHDRFGMRLLVTPQVYPEGPIYYAYFIVPADSPARSLVDLQDQRFAFSDPLSLSGTLFLMHELIKIGKRPESFFKLTIFTNSHNASVEAVADKLVDGASVMSSIWDYLAATDPALVAKTKIIHKSGQLSMGPVVVGTHVDPQLVRKLTDAFLKMDQDAAGAVVLGKLRFLKFVKVQDSFYDRVRNIQLFVNNGLYPYSIAKEVNKLNR